MKDVKSIKYKKPKIKVLGNAAEIIKGGAFNKEVGGADGLFNSSNQPVSVPD
mgnify:CR=1 FL=1